jgi:c(7)-type cytochrome triheme protein
MRRRLTILRSALLLAALALAASAAAQTMPKLPPDIVLAQSPGSPGKVTFSHANHVSFQAKPDCTACHPRLAPIVKSEKDARRAPITHEAMQKGQACGACHGKTAHGFDDCATCHR